MLLLKFVLGCDVMKVTGAGRQLDKNIMNSPSVEEKNVSDVSQPSFKEYVARESGKYHQEHISILLQKVNDQAKKLGKKVDIKELKLYKKLVSEFLDEAVNNSHKFAKENFLDKRGRHRVYAVIKKVNKELEILTTEVLKEQKDNLSILQRLEDIRGLLLDIML